MKMENKIRISEEEFYNLHKHLKDTKKSAKPTVDDGLYIVLEGGASCNFIRAFYVDKEGQPIVWRKK